MMSTSSTISTRAVASRAVRGRARATTAARATATSRATRSSTTTSTTTTRAEARERRAAAATATVAAAATALPAAPAFAHAANELAQARVPPRRLSPPRRAASPTRLDASSSSFVRSLSYPSLPFPLPSSTRPRDRPQTAANGPLESARLLVAIASIALILFQGPKGDGVVNSLNENRVFGSASEAKSAVDYVTAGLIGSFIVLSAILAANQ